MEQKTVTISMERYDRLASLETRCAVLQTVVSRAKYSLDNTDIANIIGFELPTDKADNE